MVDCCATAADDSEAAPIISAARIGYFMPVPLAVHSTTATVAPRPWLFAERPGSSRPAAARHKAIDEQQQEGADDRSDEARALARAVPAHGMPDPASNQGSGDSEQYGDDASAWVLARHQQLCEAPREPANDDPADDPVL